MELQSQNLSKFIDGHWGIVKKRLAEGEFRENRDFVFSIIKEDKSPFKSVLEILFCLKPAFGCDFVDNEDRSKEEEQLDCDAILVKMNNHKIPIYFSEMNLDQAVGRMEKHFHHLLADNKANEGWKFAVATSFRKWVILGRNTKEKERTLCSSETFDVGSANGPKSLNPFIRCLFTILRFDEEEVTKLFDEFENSRKPVQGVVLSFEEAKNNYIEELVQKGWSRNEAEELVQLYIGSDGNPDVVVDDPGVAEN